MKIHLELKNRGEVSEAFSFLGENLSLSKEIMIGF